MSEKFESRRLGKTGIVVGPLGVGAGYGVSAASVEEAFERGVRYFYWAWSRKEGMARGLRNIIKNNREKIFITITSVVPTGPMVRRSVNSALKELGTDYIDGLQFFLFKERAPFKSSQLNPALKLKDEGIIRHLGFSTHHRPNIPKFATQEFADFCHVRYNAIHRGAEDEVFRLLPTDRANRARPGLVAFTATSWGQLLEANAKKLDGLAVPTAGDCYRFALSHPQIDVCLTGPSNDKEMRHALDAVEKGPLDEDKLKWMRAVGERLGK
jgi:predicted aldo/keto reductase-like oxidoreductase